MAPGKATSATDRAVGEDCERATLRAALYKCLSTLLLAPPEAEALRVMFSDDAIEQLDWLLGEHVAKELQSLAPRARELREADRQEFFDLLAVPSARYLTPFESVYCDEPIGDDDNRKPRLAGPSMRAVEQAYSEAGFRLTANELPDHAGCELAFLAELCAQEGEAWRAGAADEVLAWRAAQDRFLEHHAGRWLGRLSERLERAASAPYLKAVAILMRASVCAHVTASRQQ